MSQKYIYYRNGEFAGEINENTANGAIKYLDQKFQAEGLSWRKDLLIRIYLVDFQPQGPKRQISIFRIDNNSGKPIDVKKKPKQWHISLRYKSIAIEGNIYDNTDQTIYVLWEEIQKNLNVDLISNIKKLEFSVKLANGELTQKGKLVLFFSLRGNYGRQWKYSELNEAMEKVGLRLVGRGIEGERPREFRYSMGYDFRTNEKDKNVPDGYCYVGIPFPFGRRNERRMANLDLEKEDWSELLSILGKNPKRLRCKVCGLFEGESNRIGQKTKFQKGHLTSHLSGGNVAASNIFSICQYCNTEQLNIYDIDPKTGKKIWNFIAAISKTNYKAKIAIYEFLKKHLKRVDVS